MSSTTSPPDSSLHVWPTSLPPSTLVRAPHPTPLVPLLTHLSLHGVRAPHLPARPLAAVWCQQAAQLGQLVSLGHVGAADNLAQLLHGVGRGSCRGQAVAGGRGRAVTERVG